MTSISDVNDTSNTTAQEKTRLSFSKTPFLLTFSVFLAVAAAHTFLTAQLHGMFSSTTVSIFQTHSFSFENLFSSQYHPSKQAE